MIPFQTVMILLGFGFIIKWLLRLLDISKGNEKTLKFPNMALALSAIIYSINLSGVMENDWSIYKLSDESYDASKFLESEGNYGDVLIGQYSIYDSYRHNIGKFIQPDIRSITNREYSADNVYGPLFLNERYNMSIYGEEFDNLIHNNKDIIIGEIMNYNPDFIVILHDSIWKKHIGSLYNQMYESKKYIIYGRM